MSFVTIVTPTKGRPTLANTIQSFYLQTYNDWNAICCFDDVKPTMEPSYKIEVIRTPTKLGEGINNAGKVRNFAIEHMQKVGMLGKYIMFCDDDDVLSIDAVRHLFNVTIKDSDEHDFYVFRMQYEHGGYLPPDGIEDILQLENKVGISFCMKSSLFLEGLTFINDNGEDYSLLKTAALAGCKFKFIPKTSYYVAPLGVAEDRK